MKKLIKNNILGFICGIILTSSIVAVATILYSANDIVFTPNNEEWDVSNVGEALNNLFEDKKTKGKIIQIYNNNYQYNIDYTYTVEEAGTYLVGVMSAKDSPVANIITNGTVTIDHSESAHSSRLSTVKVINANVGNTIRVVAQGFVQTGFTSNAFIYKLEDISVTTVVNATTTYDTFATYNYTASADNDKVLSIAFSCGATKSNDIIYNDGIKVTYLHLADAYVDYFVLKNGESFTAKSYGYNWGGGSVYILK